MSKPYWVEITGSSDPNAVASGHVGYFATAVEAQQHAELLRACRLTVQVWRNNPHGWDREPIANHAAEVTP